MLDVAALRSQNDDASDDLGVLDSTSDFAFEVALSEFDLENIDSVSLTSATQAQLELLYSKYQVISCLTKEFLKAGAAEGIESVGIPPAFGIDLAVQLVLHKRAKIPVLVGMLKHHFDQEENPAQACADMILKACQEDLCDWDPMTETVVVIYDLTGNDPHLRAKLDRFQYPLPMIEPPQEVKNNRQTGYLTIKKSIILKDNHLEKDVCLDHINRVNQVPLALNMDVVAFVQNRWKGLDKPKPDETTEKFRARKRAFEKYDRVSRDVLQALVAQGNRFWLTHRYDKRGRTYSQGYHVNYQGNDWNKACIEFADAEPLR